MSESMAELIRERNWSAIRELHGERTSSYLERMYAEPRRVTVEPRPRSNEDYIDALWQRISAVSFDDGSALSMMRLSLLSGINYQVLSRGLSGFGTWTAQTKSAIESAMVRVEAGLTVAELPKFRGTRLTASQSAWADDVRARIKSHGTMSSFAVSVGISPSTLHNISCKMYPPSPDLKRRIEDRLMELEAA